MSISFKCSSGLNVHCPNSMSKVISYLNCNENTGRSSAALEALKTQEYYGLLHVVARNDQLRSREFQERHGNLLGDRSRRGRCGSSLSIHVRKARPSQQRICRTRTCHARSFLPSRGNEWAEEGCFLGTLFRRQSIDRVPSLLFFFRRNLYAVRSGTHSGCLSFFLVVDENLLNKNFINNN